MIHVVRASMILLIAKRSVMWYAGPIKLPTVAAYCFSAHVAKVFWSQDISAQHRQSYSGIVSFHWC